MYARFIYRDPKVVKVIQPMPLKVDMFGVVDGKGQIDNGLGFGQGSLAGVMKPKHQCSGFQRPRLQDSDCAARKLFNLHRLCTSPYSCHLDISKRCPMFFPNEIWRSIFDIVVEKRDQRSILAWKNTCGLFKQIFDDWCFNMMTETKLKIDAIIDLVDKSEEEVVKIDGKDFSKLDVLSHFQPNQQLIGIQKKTKLLCGGCFINCAHVMPIAIRKDDYVFCCDCVLHNIHDVVPEKRALLPSNILEM